MATLDEKKEYAKFLFLRENLTQKDVAKKSGLSENTITKLKQEGKWDDLKITHIMTKEEELRRLYVMLKATNDVIEKRDKIPNAKEADTINKLTASIRQLQTEIGVAEIIDVATEMVSFYKTMDFEKAKELTTLFDAFIQQKLISK